MPTIKNSRDLAEEIAAGIHQVKDEFDLRTVSMCSGKNIPVEVDCEETYQEGVSITASFKEHLSLASGFVEHVSRKLEEADREVSFQNHLDPASIFNMGGGGIH